MAFANDPSFSSSAIKRDNDNVAAKTTRLVNGAEPKKLKDFLAKGLIKSKDLRSSLAIFLQGQKEIATRQSDYETRIKKQLDGLDLEDLLQAWFASPAMIITAMITMAIMARKEMIFYLFNPLNSN